MPDGVVLSRKQLITVIGVSLVAGVVGAGLFLLIAPIVHAFWKEKDYTNVEAGLGEPDAAHVPKAGDCLVFQQNIMHEGEKLEHGQKFMIRSDIMFHQVSAADVPRNVRAALALVRDAEVKEEEGDMEEAVRLFAEAEEMDPRVFD